MRADRNVVSLIYLFRHIIAGDAEVSSFRFLHYRPCLPFHHHLHISFDVGDRNGIAHAFYLCICHLNGIDPHQFPFHIEQGAAAVARVDRRIGLDILVGAADRLAGSFRRYGTSQRTDNTCRYGLAIAKCIADRHDLLP